MILIQIARELAKDAPFKFFITFQIHARQLPLQMPVVRRAGKRLGDARGDLAAQLRRGGSCVCNDQKFIEVGGVCGVGQIAPPTSMNF